MIEELLDFERDWFLAINGTHTAWLDALMLSFASPYAWCPLILVPIYFFLKKRSDSLIMSACTALTVVCNGLITSLITKPLLSRLRPTNHPDFAAHVRILHDYVADGLFGFFSGHATNAFAFAVLSALVLRNRYYTAGVFVWALVMVYSRVYLGAHFISDVVPGMIVGALIGWALYILYGYLQKKI
ncbi:MAG: phosphatase PAP2 family protein [Tannerella sp.]|jgi:undecaprenyl-diphosphatase|nr:phosphatase PAP2 family protein [Tannerella sp.]